MLVGRVDLGGSFQACSASYSCTEDAMARSIVRLECENEELRAEVALLREERNILARAKAAVTEGAEPSCNDSAQVFRERPEPSPHFSDTPETEAHSPGREMTYSDCFTNEQLHHALAKAVAERNEAREEARRATYDAAQETIKVGTVKSHWIEACRERDEARVQFRAAEGLGMALVKTIDELKTEKAELTVKLVNLQAGSRPASLEDIRESVREKYDPEYEFGGGQDE